MPSKEQKFYSALRDVFIGAKIEGKGGFINLMKIKANYYKKIEEQINKDINKELTGYPGFRDELFDKLYSFFNRYFTQNGSIYFNDTGLHNDVYEKVYTNEKDVMLFWKTQMLYYVKTDSIFRSQEIEFDGLKFFFDPSQLENKKANEKNSLIFNLKEVRDRVITFDVQYSTNGSTIKTDEILEELKTKRSRVTEEQLERAFRIFKAQSKVDFFINKNAKSFLQEQFKLWSYQYFWQGTEEKTEWTPRRVNQLASLKRIAFKLIDFVSQFEDELVKIWNKPKFVKSSNYVITLDRLEKNLVNKIKKHPGYKKQVLEWKELDIDEANPKAPIDTKYFKDLELDILAQFDHLDEALDGWLIKSENYQALNTILPKFKDKVQTIYLDPPFNTGSDFEYVDRFQDASWLSLMRDKLILARDFLSDSGYLYLQLDHYADYLGRHLLVDVFQGVSVKDQAFITWNTGENISGFKTQRNNWIRQADKIMFSPKEPGNTGFIKLWEPLKEEKDKKIGWLDFMGNDKEHLYIEKWENGKLEKKAVDVRAKRIGTVWNTIYSFQYSEPRETESFSFETQKPENLLRRIIQSCSKPGDLVLDFFSGSGTTCAVAQKLNRKWIAVEGCGYIDNFYSDNNKIKKVGILGRMKIVLNGDREFSLPNTPQKRSPHLSKDINWEGGGFFKYYELEQYEEALAGCKYADGDMLGRPDETDYEQYVFLRDEKMCKAMEIDYKNNKVRIDLNKLYPNIDIAETLSNLTGKAIKSIKENKVEFDDGTETDTKDLDYREIKNLIWWE